MFVGVRSLAILLCLALWVGCRARDCCPSGCPCPAEREQLFGCRPVPREPLVADLSSLTAAQHSPDTSDPQSYCALPEREAQCLAAMNDALANLLLKEAEALTAQGNAGSSLTSDLLVLRATHERNQAAGRALTAFWRLLEAEAGAQNLRVRVREVDAMLAELDRLRERGILPPVPRAEIEQQRLELWHKQVELLATLDQLNHNLQLLIGADLMENAHFWPEAALQVDGAVPNRDEAINVAFAQRADLAAIALAAGSSGEEQGEAARVLLSASGSGLGIAPPTPCCLSLLMLMHAGDCAAPVRSQQLCDLLADRRRTARHEVAQAAFAIQVCGERIRLTKRRLELAQGHLRAVEEQREAIASPALAVLKARLTVLGVEQDLLHDVVEWKLAGVKLREAQGLLAVECGYDEASRALRCAVCQP